MIENKASLSRDRVKLIEKIATPLAREERLRLQEELSIINAKIKALNTAEAARLKAVANRKKIAGLTEAQANAARARIKLDGNDVEPPMSTAIDDWISDVLQRRGMKVHRAPSDGKLGIEVPSTVPKQFTAALHTLCDGLRALSRGEELPLLWNGMCSVGKHGLDFEEQPCDLCALAKAPSKAKKR